VFDVIVSGGEIVDGTGAARYRSDIGVQGDRIAAIGDLAHAACHTRIDATQRIVAPGFIDVHNHSDGWMLKYGGLESKIAQGFTTEVIMADGISYAPVGPDTALQWIYYLRALNGLQLSDYTGWQSLNEYLTQLQDGLRVNVAAHAAYANLRSLAQGFSPRALDDFAARTVRGELRRSLQDGAVGLSTGLDYIVECHATTDELVDACRVVAEFDGLYVTHLR
jgi:N-acyl-D-amino-acid deacylase